jgi:hypothetical protein
MTVRTVIVFRLRPDAALQDRDRLVDERSGEIFQVDTFTQDPAVVGVADVRVVTIRVAA